jgi:hypothetical protein
MTAHNQQISMISGDTHTVRFVCTKPDGSPFPLADGSPVMTVARSLGPNATVVLQKIGTFDQITMSGQTYYRANFVLAPADTVSVEPRQYMHQCEARMPGGAVYTFADGPFLLGASMPFGGA